MTPPTFTKPFPGPIVLIGFGSIGRATLPLLHRHITRNDDSPIIIICPDEQNKDIATSYGASFITEALTPDNYKTVLGQIIGNDKPRGCIIQVANEVGSRDIALFAAQHNAHYIDTVVEPWPGFYFNPNIPPESKTNYALRESFRSLRHELQNTPTAISCCGANPGMVSWFVKAALLTLAKDTGYISTVPQSRKDWAKLMCDLGVKGIHIAEKDTQQRLSPKQPNEFVNTWSIEGFVAEGLQPAELGWGTHEIVLPPKSHTHATGCRAAIYLDSPGGTVKVRTWTPTAGSHFGYLITHNEAISIADYFTLTGDHDEVLFRPTCHYAYHPIDAAVTSLTELFDERNGQLQETLSLLEEQEIVSGTDQLGVLLYGHEKGALWYGSTLSIEDTRMLAPHQNATGLQVSSAILAGLCYCIDHPDEGVLETDELDHEQCLSIQVPYLGTVSAHYTDWQPEARHHEDPWQFVNIRYD
jgi:homospermidine synthase